MVSSQADLTRQISTGVAPEAVRGARFRCRTRRFDPVGGFVREGSMLGTDDVGAHQPATNTWTMLLAPSQDPASYGPG